ncbi:hypothetical protein DNTS_035446 [Danionella cerebrum]|uniref:Ig-like domain-containing protein n=1 Tax=Danionella cerebrum TaxID=2873325 RepID=A0A553QQ90_9TELE|nr:hypothetical protein DNTS_035446 [Danionella translucida]
MPLFLLCCVGLLGSVFASGTFGMNQNGNKVKDISLEVHPDSRQHLEGNKFTLSCSAVNGSDLKGSILKRLQQDKIHSGCLQMNGTILADEPEGCHFYNIDVKTNGLYWCESSGQNRTSNTINITVIYNSTVESNEENQSGSLAWVSGLCIILVLLVAVPVIWLLFPGLREKLFACPNGAWKREMVPQEMPKTKQDVTEVQWDLPWMEMDNLLQKQQQNTIC